MIEERLATISAEVARVIPTNLALEFGILAIDADQEQVTIAGSKALLPAELARLERVTGRRIRAHVVSAHILAPELARCYGLQMVTIEESGEPTAIRIVESLLRRAIVERASDMHLTMRETILEIRMRIDGVLRRCDALEAPLSTRVVSRLKLITGMDIAERRLPQDGRMSFVFEKRTLDIRMASLPTESGEQLALRFFDTQRAAMRVDELGMPRYILENFSAMIAKASGLILVCGPTGSGKTTTLYAALESINHDTRHICTIEDPVERRIPGLSQVAINTRSGLDFSVALRAIIRQDPDVIMIGEIRDPQTAQTAVSAALTGQLVIASVHSPHAFGAIERLRELGVSASTLSTVLSGIIAQRLVRRLCTLCRWATVDEFQAVGCADCGQTGYRGRLPLFDFLHEDRLHRELQENSRLQTVESDSAAMATCINDYVVQGMTTLAECQRVSSLWTTRQCR